MILSDISRCAPRAPCSMSGGTLKGPEKGLIPVHTRLRFSRAFLFVCVSPLLLLAQGSPSAKGPITKTAKPLLRLSDFKTPMWSQNDVDGGKGALVYSRTVYTTWMWMSQKDVEKDIFDSLPFNSRTVYTRPPFYLGHMPLTFVEGKRPRYGGTCGTELRHDDIFPVGRGRFHGLISKLIHQ